MGEPIFKPRKNSFCLILSYKSRTPAMQILQILDIIAWIKDFGACLRLAI
ncbi:MAG: hypothetical protein KBS54_02540 [Synergistaceae bacterium]|nr:hypothetical protein [Candidatus Equadaptatus faecalis]